MSAKTLTNGGIVTLIFTYIIKIIYLPLMLLLWKSIIASGANAGMSLNQLLIYTFLGALLSDMLTVRTQASSWLYEGLFISLYQRPMSVILQLVAQTIGAWMPQLLLITLPAIAVSVFLGFDYSRCSLWFVPSLAFCIVLGFAVDLLFACLTIRLQRASWVVHVIRNSLITFFAGNLIPFAVLPWGIGDVLRFIPFGSLAAAPLSVLVGIADPAYIIATQIVWIALLWPLALFVFRKSGEMMMSYGG